MIFIIFFVNVPIYFVIIYSNKFISLPKRFRKKKKKKIEKYFRAYLSSKIQWFFNRKNKKPRLIEIYDYRTDHINGHLTFYEQTFHYRSVRILSYFNLPATIVLP